jgi:hypothetical protein
MLRSSPDSVKEVKAGNLEENRLGPVLELPSMKVEIKKDE